MKADDFNIISLFTGAGGLDIGLEAAGFDVAVAIENDADCLATIRRNTSWRISSTTDVMKVDAKTLLSEAGLKPREPALVVGGPPCQPFSKAGYWVNGYTKRLNDDRADTIKHYFRIVGAILPKAILFENVLGIGFRDKSEALRLIESELRKINRRHRTNYTPVFLTVNAADYGVPQTRERLFVVASRDETTLALPTATHGPVDSGMELSAGVSRYTTAWDAIGDLDSICHGDALSARGKWSDLLPTIPEGQNYLWHTPRGGGIPLFGWRTRYWSFLLKLKKSRPSWTLQASPGPAIGPFHWRSRRLSEREMARIQTFPDSHSFVGSYGSVTRQIGNAVPPAIGELFGRCMMNQFFENAIGTSLTLVPKASKITPRAHRRRSVPQKFSKIAQSPDAHPGPGNGPRALSQRA